MKSKQDTTSAPVAGLLPAFSQEKTSMTLTSREDYNHCKNDCRLHIQDHGATQNTAVFQMGSRQFGRCQSLFCQTVKIAAMLERRGGGEARAGFGAKDWYGREWRRHGDGVLASSLLRTELIFLP